MQPTGAIVFDAFGTLIRYTSRPAPYGHLVDVAGRPVDRLACLMRNVPLATLAIEIGAGDNLDLILPDLAECHIPDDCAPWRRPARDRMHLFGTSIAWAFGMQIHAPALFSCPQAPPTDAWRDPLALLLASTGEGIYGVDLDGLCIFINPAGARLIGYEPDEVLGRNMHELTHHARADGSSYPEAECPIFNAFRQGLPCRIDSEVFWRRDGTAFPVEYSSHPIVDQGQVRGAVVTFVDITERRRAADALQHAKDRLEDRVHERTLALETALKQVRELAARSESVREEERTRIAREVHDELGSLLVALKMDVNWMDRRLSEQQQRSSEAAEDMRGRMRCKCQNMSRLIETAVDNVGRIITDLRPSILDHQGLWAALEWQALEFVQSAELALRWCMDVGDAPDPPEPLAMAVFRIFQEMLSNVGRHAHARRLEVQIVVQAGVLRLSVQDDGRGAPAQAFEAADAYGVMGMRERARHFGGEVDIHSTPGLGTRMRLTITLPSGESA